MFEVGDSPIGVTLKRGNFIDSDESSYLLADSMCVAWPARKLGASCGRRLPLADEGVAKRPSLDWVMAQVVAPR